MVANLVDAPFAVAEKAAKYLLRALRADPQIAIVLGSGWGLAADELATQEVEISVGILPGFVAPGVGGHEGRVRLVKAGGREVLVLLGRSHLYEGRSAAEVVHPVRTAVIAGARTVVLTNAAGSLRADLRIGQVALLRDHINLTGASPLSGAAPPAPYGSRFVDLTDLYSARLRALARTVDPDLPEGVYAALPGPHYETPAEIAMLRAGGADLVGMSTVLEAIAARHLGAQVLGLSLVTNLAAGMTGAGMAGAGMTGAGMTGAGMTGSGVSAAPVDHAEVLATGAAGAPRLGHLLSALLPLL